MATYATLTINAEDIIGADFDRSRASVWVEANTEHGLIVVDGTSIRVGGRRENLVDGVATFQLVTTNSADNPTSFGYRVTIVYVPKGSRKQGHDTVTTSDFPLTASANLAAIPEAWDNVTIPPSWRSEFRDEMIGYSDAAAASASDAADISNIAVDDDIVEALVKGTAGAGPKTRAILAKRHMLNILDYGVTTGTTSSQTVAIKAALDANTGKAFYFPPGDYRLDTQLNVTASNSIDLAPGARIYAGAAMDTLINYDNGAGSASGYAQDKFLTGKGLLDANLNASKALTIGSVIRFSLGDGLTIKNPINRGIYLKPLGAEVIGRDIRLYNTGTTNATDNIAIEVDMSDCQFADIIARDFTIGVWDKGGSTVWDRTHPWIGDSTQLAARYPTSIAFKVTGNSRMNNPYADTYRIGWQITGGSTRLRIKSPYFYIAEGNLSEALADANTGTVFDFTNAGTVSVEDGHFKGHSLSPFAFTAGDTRHFYARNNTAADTTGVVEIIKGVTQGYNFFGPNLIGATTAGTQTYTVNSGFYYVHDGMVTYAFRMQGTFGATIAGNLRVGNLPRPPGAASVNTGYGTIMTSFGAGAIQGGNGSASTQTAIPIGSTGAEIAGAALAGQTFTIFGQITCPFTYQV